MFSRSYNILVNQAFFSSIHCMRPQSPPKFAHRFLLFFYGLPVSIYPTPPLQPTQAAMAYITHALTDGSTPCFR